MQRAHFPVTVFLPVPCGAKRHPLNAPALMFQAQESTLTDSITGWLSFAIEPFPSVGFASLLI